MNTEMLKPILIYGSLAIVTVVLAWYIYHSLRKADQGYKMMASTFAQAGLYPVGKLPTNAQVLDATQPLQFVGTYRGLPAGYNQGRAAISFYTQKVRYQSADPNSYYSFATGMEFWVGEHLNGPSLAIFERNDPTWNLLSAGLIPQNEVQFVDIAFANRFHVRCDSGEWALKLISPQLRKALLAMPFVFLLVHQGKVIFVMAFSGENFAKAFGKDLRQTTQEPKQFLEAAWLLANEIIQQSN